MKNFVILLAGFYLRIIRQHTLIIVGSSILYCKEMDRKSGKLKILECLREEVSGDLLQ